MPDPTDLHVDKILSNLSLAYENAELIGGRLFPTVPVGKQSDKYFIYGKERFNVPDTRYSKKAGFNRVDWSLSNNPYYCDLHGLEGTLTEIERDNADDPVNAEAETAEIVTDQVLLAKEVKIVGKVTDTAVITQYDTLTGTDRWDDPNSDPIAKVEAMKGTIEGNAIPEPNTLIVPKEVHRKLKDHPKIIAKLAYTERGILTEQILAAMFEVRNYWVPASFYNTEIEGQDPVLARVWGKNVLLAYVPPRAGRKVIGLGFTFQWKARRVARYPERKTLAEVFQVFEAVDEKIVAPEAAYLLKTVVS